MQNSNRIELPESIDPAIRKVRHTLDNICDWYDVMKKATEEFQRAKISLESEVTELKRKIEELKILIPPEKLKELESNP